MSHCACKNLVYSTAPDLQQPKCSSIGLQFRFLPAAEQQGRQEGCNCESEMAGSRDLEFLLNTNDDLVCAELLADQRQAQWLVCCAELPAPLTFIPSSGQRHLLTALPCPPHSLPLPHPPIPSHNVCTQTTTCGNNVEKRFFQEKKMNSTQLSVSETRDNPTKRFWELWYPYCASAFMHCLAFFVLAAAYARPFQQCSA